MKNEVLGSWKILIPNPQALLTFGLCIEPHQRSSELRPVFQGRETKMAMMERRWIPNLIVPGAQAPVSIQPPLRGEEMSKEPNHILHSQFFILHSSFSILHSSFSILHSSFPVARLKIMPTTFGSSFSRTFSERVTSGRRQV